MIGMLSTLRLPKPQDNSDAAQRAERLKQQGIDLEREQQTVRDAALREALVSHATISDAKLAKLLETAGVELPHWPELVETYESRKAMAARLGQAQELFGKLDEASRALERHEQERIAWLKAWGQRAARPSAAVLPGRGLLERHADGPRSAAIDRASQSARETNPSAMRELGLKRQMLVHEQKPHAAAKGELLRLRENLARCEGLLQQAERSGQINDTNSFRNRRRNLTERIAEAEARVAKAARQQKQIDAIDLQLAPLLPEVEAINAAKLDPLS